MQALNGSEMVERYARFLNDTGDLDNKTHLGSLDCNSPFNKSVRNLFSKSLIKKVNGMIAFFERKCFESQLVKAKETYRSWSIQILEVIPAEDTNKVTVQYRVSTWNGTHLIAFVVLTFKHSRKYQEMKICEINEVLTQELYKK